MDNELTAIALIEYANLIKMDDIENDLSNMDYEFRSCDKLLETINSCSKYKYTLNESSKSDAINNIKNSAIKTLVRKLKALASQLIATIKKLRGIDKIPKDGEYIDINKTLSVLDKIENYDNSYSLIKKYYVGEKIDVNKLQSLINRCNKMIDSVENDEDNNRKLRLIKYILNQSKTLMGDLIKLAHNSPEVMESNKKRFKEKYKYDPKNKTIVFDGETYKIRMSDDNDTKVRGLINNGASYNQKGYGTSANLLNKRGGIYLDDTFFKLKTDEQRAAILAHEIAHLKYHSVNAKSKHLDKELVTDGNIEKAKSFASYNDLSKNNRGFYKKNKKLKELKEKNKNNKRNIDRRKNIEKYEKANDSHINTDEFEADRYAANKYGDIKYKKALKEYNKESMRKDNFNKNYDDYINSIKQATSELLKNDNLSEIDRFRLKSILATLHSTDNKSVKYKLNRFIDRLKTKYIRHKDLQARFKALKAKVNKDVYKDKAKNEAIELLYDELLLCENINDFEIVLNALGCLND